MVPVDGTPTPLLFRPDTGLEAVVISSPHDAAVLFGLNDEGVLVGSATSAGIETALRVEGDSSTLLHLPGAYRSVAYDIDDAGWPKPLLTHLNRTDNILLHSSCINGKAPARGISKQ